MSKRCMKAPDSLIYCNPETGEKLDLMPSIIAGAEAMANLNPPTAGPSDAGSTSSEEELSGDLTGVTQAGDDPNLVYTLDLTDPKAAAVTLNVDGTYTVDTAGLQVGSCCVGYTVTDGNGLTAESEICWEVLDNQAPTIPDGQGIPDLTNNEGDTIDLPIDKAVDVDGTVVSVTATGLPPGVIVSPGNPFALIGSPDAGSSLGGPASTGVYDVVLTYTDDDGATVECPFTWTITVETFNFVEEGGDDSDISDVIEDVIANGGTIVINGVVLTDPSMQDIQDVITNAGGTITSTDDFAWTGAPDIPVCVNVETACGLKNALEPSDTFADTVTEISNDGNGGGVWHLIYPSMTIEMTFTQTSAGSTQGIVELQNQNRQVGIGGFLGTPLDPPAKTAVEYDVSIEIINRREINGCINGYDIFGQVFLMETLDTTAEFNDAFLFNPGDFITQNGQTFVRNETNGTAGEVFFMWKTDDIGAAEGTATNLTGGADRPVLGDGPFDISLTLSDPVRFDLRVIERVPVQIIKCGDTFISAEGADGNSYAEGDVTETI